jgi:protein SCO1/2
MRRILVTIVAVCCLSTAGCKKPQAKHYPLEAEVIKAEPAKSSIIIRHGEIPGYMAAMVMSYTVQDPQQIGDLHPGDRIKADLAVTDDRAQLEKIQLVRKAEAAPAPPPEPSGTPPSMPEHTHEMH